MCKINIFIILCREVKLVYETWTYLCSVQVNGQLQTVDKLINMLMTSLYENNLHNCVNMIIVADHGMGLFSFLLSFSLLATFIFLS